MGTIKNTKNNKRWQEYGEKGTLKHCWWECKLLQPPWKTVWKLLKKLKIDLPYDSQFHSWGHTQRNASQVTRKVPAHPCLLPIAKLWK
jgi:hypothetical protein